MSDDLGLSVSNPKWKIVEIVQGSRRWTPSPERTYF